MKYFLDSAKIDEIRYAYANLAIEGITTNPNHIKNSGRPLSTIIDVLSKEFEGKDFPISIEVDPHLERAEDIIKAAKELSDLSPNFVIKIPCTIQGLIAAKSLVEMGIKTNVTLVFTISQAIQVARIGSTYVSPFIGWRENNGEDGVAYVCKIKEIYRRYGYKTEVIAAAVRTGRQISELAANGVDIITAGLSVYEESFISPYTDMGIAKFAKAWEETIK